MEWQLKKRHQICNRNDYIQHTDFNITAATKKKYVINIASALCYSETAAHVQLIWLYIYIYTPRVQINAFRNMSLVLQVYNSFLVELPANVTPSACMCVMNILYHWCVVHYCNSPYMLRQAITSEITNVTIVSATYVSYWHALGYKFAVVFILEWLQSTKSRHTINSILSSKIWQNQILAYLWQNQILAYLSCNSTQTYKSLTQHKSETEK